MKRNYPEMDPELDRRDRVRRMKSPIDRRQQIRREPSPMMSNNRVPPMSRDPYDDFPPPPPRPKEREQHVYKILCVGNLNAKVNDTIIHDSLLREFNRFGDVSVKVCHDSNERFAYIYFRSYDEAREARHAKSRLILHDKQLEVEPIFERTIPSSASNQRRRSSTPDYYNNRPAVTNQRTNNLRTNPQMSNSPRNQRGNMNQMNPHQSSNQSMMKHHNNNQYQRNYNQNNNQMNNHHHQDHHNYNNNLNRNNNLNHHNQMHHQNHMRNDNYHLNNNQNNHHSNNQNNHMNHNQNHHMRPQRESKKDKFPNYLHHIPPEEDKMATRTLFVGNLEVTISDQDLKRIFEKYGSVEDIDVKRPPPGQGNAYAFIKFLNLDMAHKCKVEMSGQYIGKFQCKIGYGKCTPTTRLWVGGLGSWTSLQHLEREFDRFGAIRKIDFVKGDNHAYIQYDSIDAAQAACQEMRGHPLGGPDKRLRVDFADPEPYNYNLVGNSAPGPASANQTTGNIISNNLRNNNSGLAIDSLPNAGGFQSSNPNTPLDSNTIANPSNEEWQEDGEENGLNKQYDNGLKSTTSPRNGLMIKRARTSDLINEQGITKKSRQSSLDDVESETTNLDRSANVIISENVTTIQELIKCCPVAWNGGLILKTMKFPARMLLCDGDISLVDSLLKDPNNEGPVLRITQRLRLDPIRLEDVSRRMSTSGHCMLLTTQGSDKFNKAGGEDVRPIRNLVSYLKQKEAAGVVSLQANKEEGNDALGVLYVFPPCAYASDLLKKVAPNLIIDLSSKDTKEDYLVVIVVKGG